LTDDISTQYTTNGGTRWCS